MIISICCHVIYYACRHQQSGRFVEAEDRRVRFLLRLKVVECILECFAGRQIEVIMSRFSHRSSSFLLSFVSLSQLRPCYDPYQSCSSGSGLRILSNFPDPDSFLSLIMALSRAGAPSPKPIPPSNPSNSTQEMRELCDPEDINARDDEDAYYNDPSRWKKSSSSSSRSSSSSSSCPCPSRANQEQTRLGRLFFFAVLGLLAHAWRLLNQHFFLYPYSPWNTSPCTMRPYEDFRVAPSAYILGRDAGSVSLTKRPGACAVLGGEPWGLSSHKALDVAFGVAGRLSSAGRTEPKTPAKRAPALEGRMAKLQVALAERLTDEALKEFLLARAVSLAGAVAGLGLAKQAGGRGGGVLHLARERGLVRGLSRGLTPGTSTSRVLGNGKNGTTPTGGVPAHEKNGAWSPPTQGEQLISRSDITSSSVGGASQNVEKGPPPLWPCPPIHYTPGRNHDYENRGCHRLAGEWGKNIKCAQYCKAVSIGLLIGYRPDDLVLDWGSGCGHQLAWLGHLFGTKSAGLEQDKRLQHV